MGEEKSSHALTYYLGHQMDDVLDKWHRKVYNLFLGARPTDLASALPTDLANGPKEDKCPIFPKNAVYYNRCLTFPPPPTPPPLPFPEMASRQ